MPSFVHCLSKPPSRRRPEESDVDCPSNIFAPDVEPQYLAVASSQCDPATDGDDELDQIALAFD
jgi:hypothetical protein